MTNNTTTITTKKGVFLVASVGNNPCIVSGYVGTYEGKAFGIHKQEASGPRGSNKHWEWIVTDLASGIKITRYDEYCSKRDATAHIPELMARFQNSLDEALHNGNQDQLKIWSTGKDCVWAGLGNLLDAELITDDQFGNYHTTGSLPFKASDCVCDGVSLDHDPTRLNCMVINGVSMGEPMKQTA